VGCLFEGRIIIEWFCCGLSVLLFCVKLKRSAFDDRSKMKEVMKVAKVATLDIEILLHKSVAGAFVDTVLFCGNDGSVRDIEGHSEQ
jgi:hypothetical protein